MPAPLLDSDVLSEIFKARNDHVRELVHRYLHLYGTYFFSVVTRFEVLRGLRMIDARPQIRRFDLLCDRSWVEPITEEAADHAAEIYAELQAIGRPVGIADILIAGSARSENRAVATRNVSHYEHMPGVLVEDWRDPPD